MKLEQQFTTIEQSKKLVELGIDANLAKFWHVSVTRITDTDFDKAEFETVQYIVAKTDSIFVHAEHIAPAFSMAEVLFMLNHYWDDIDMSEGVYEQANLLIDRIIETSDFDMIKYINEELQD